jgi:hypothetical protein
MAATVTTVYNLCNVETSNINSLKINSVAYKDKNKTFGQTQVYIKDGQLISVGSIMHQHRKVQ